MPPCSQCKLCSQHTIDFTSDPNSGRYGSYKSRSDENVHYHGGSTEFEICARPGMMALNIQSQILNFLVDCACKILHEMPPKLMIEFPPQDEPPMADLLDFEIAGHTNFSDVLMTAPYRGWQSVDLTELPRYIAATFDTQKEHVWALREDPSYFADTVLEYEQHSGPDTSNDHHRLGEHYFQRDTLIREILEEAYSTLAGWQDLRRRISDLDRLFQWDANIYGQITAVHEVKDIAL